MRVIRIGFDENQLTTCTLCGSQDSRIESKLHDKQLIITCIDCRHDRVLRIKTKTKDGDIYVLPDDAELIAFEDLPY